MPRRLLGVFLLLLVSVSFVRAQGDIVLFTVGSEPICKDEFEFHFSKSSEKRADVFVETYARFKQKVRYAKEIGLDTLTSYREWVKQSKSALKGCQQETYESRVQQAGREWMKVVHITYPLKQSAHKREAQRGMQYMDSLYAVLPKNVKPDVEEGTWVQTRYLLNEWKGQLAHLVKDEYSKPFYSPLGIHIIAWKDKRLGIEPDEARPVDDTLWKMQEIEDGWLAVALDEYLDKRLVATEQELKTHFKKHRSAYGGGIPHFSGAVIYCQDKKEAKAIKKYLKKYPQVFWKEAMERIPAKVSERCKAEVGLFALGSHPCVDKLVFKCGDFEPSADYPYVWVSGKKLKKGPEDYRDVREKVEKDWREGKKKAEMEAIIQKYRVEIDKEVLKTVNRAENK